VGNSYGEDMDHSNICNIVSHTFGIGRDGFSYLITGDTENDCWDTITKLIGKIYVPTS